MENRVLAFGLSFLRPPAIYAAVTVLARLCRLPLSPSSVFFFICLFTLLLSFSLFSSPSLCCWGRRQRPNSLRRPPAYASVFGHFAAVDTVFLIKILRVSNGFLSLTFLILSSVFGYLFIRVVKSDPGHVDSKTLDREGSSWRGKYCHYCHAFVHRYDHHCGAVDNCIGSKNHKLFMVLLTMACFTEILYMICSFSYLQQSVMKLGEDQFQGDEKEFLDDIINMAFQLFFAEPWVVSTAIFVVLQFLWQLPFLLFQIYLTATNLTIDEWVNWEDIPNLYEEVGLHHSKIFVNPYDEGIVGNFKAMLREWK